jgi:ribonuclease Z
MTLLRSATRTHLLLRLATYCSVSRGSLHVTTSTNASIKTIDPFELIRKMPKDPVAARALKQQRLEKEKNNKTIHSIPSLISIGVLGNGGTGAPSCMFLTTDHHTYLFNCGEGTQRLAQEHGWRLSKCSNVFVTQAKWKNIGGLCGLGLTLQSIGVPRLNLHGPPNLITLFDHAAQFGVTADLLISQLNKNNETFIDSCMKVEYVPLYPIRVESEPKESNNGSPTSKRVKSNQLHDSSVYCYVCTLHNKPGKLDLQKCIDLKVPRGPMLAQLKAGMDVSLEDGRVIRQQDVCDQQEKGERFLVLDCPSVDYMDSLLVDPKIAAAIVCETHPLACVVHFTPTEVLQTKQYQQWLTHFNSSVQHILINDRNSALAYADAHKLQEKLSLIDEDVFPPLNVIDKADPFETPDFKISSQIVQPATNFEFVMRPKGKKVIHIEPLCHDSSVAQKELNEVDGIQQAIEQYKLATKDISAQRETYPEVITFGTGSAVSGKLRNASCLLINLSETSSMLFDCGEGSLGQLRRFYGEERSKQIVRNLKSIFISHLHADHHIGLLSFLNYRKQLQKEHSLDPLVLYLPDAVYHFLLKMDSEFEPLVTTYEYRDNPRIGTQEVSSAYVQKSDVAAISLAKVKHCRQSCGIAIQTKPNAAGKSYKIVYSGDAMPTNTLVEIGQDADLLVHEATLDDVHYMDALAKHHSTTSQAIDMGNQMNARYTLLTHFSQRYSKLPFITETFTDRVGVAFDNMRLRLSDVSKLGPLVDVMKVLFANEFGELKRRNDQKIKQEQLLKSMLEKQKMQN